MPVPMFSFPLPDALTWRPDAAALRRAVELAIVLLLGMQAARLAWVVFAPLGPFGATQPDVAALAPAPALAPSRDPFFPASTTAAAPTAAGGGFTLFGVNVDGGSAILAGKDGRQASWRTGQEVAPGARLHAVDAGGVVLDLGGRQQRLALQPRTASSPALAPAGQLPSARATGTGADTTPTVDPAALLQQAGLRPRMTDGRIDGYTLIPRGDDALVRQAGLRAGDVVVAINGNTLTPERLGELESDLAGRDAVELTVLRDGTTRTLTLRTPTP